MLQKLSFILISIASIGFFSAPHASAEEQHDKSKEWALYSWIADDGKWHYSLVRGTEHHPDASEVGDSATSSLEAIKSRLSLLDQGSEVDMNPLPVLNLELHKPPTNTIQEFERVCNSAKLILVKAK